MADMKFKFTIQPYQTEAADPNAYDNYGDTPLSHASIDNHKDVAELLLKYGADPNVKNKYGNTPLHYASERGSKYIVELLLKHGA